MRTHHNIDTSRAQSFGRFSLFLAGTKPAEFFDGDWKILHPITKRIEVLLDKNSRRREHRDLKTIFNRAKRGPHRDLCFPKADIAA